MAARPRWSLRSSYSAVAPGDLSVWQEKHPGMCAGREKKGARLAPSSDQHCTPAVCVTFTSAQQLLMLDRLNVVVNNLMKKTHYRDALLRETDNTFLLFLFFLALYTTHGSDCNTDTHVYTGTFHTQCQFKKLCIR